jgi:hypothetical protein
MRKLFVLFLCFTFCADTTISETTEQVTSTTVEQIDTDNTIESSNDTMPEVTYTNCLSEPIAKTTYDFETELKSGNSDIIELTINLYRNDILVSSIVYDRDTYEEYGVFPNADEERIILVTPTSSFGYKSLKLSSETVIVDREGVSVSGMCTVEFILETNNGENQDYDFEYVELETPPYSGTIFITGDIITEDDPSTFEALEFIGQELRWHYDRRDDLYIDREMFIFTATFTDYPFLSLEFYASDFTEEQAYKEAQKYSYLFGQLPAVLKKDVNIFVINSDDDSWGGANGGTGVGYIYIHTGMSSIYENEIFGNILEETLIHEAAHVSLDTEIYQMSAWKQAVLNDNQFISTYAQDYEGENISELMPVYIAIKYFPERISREVYNNVLSTSFHRIKFLDSLPLDFSIYER